MLRCSKRHMNVFSVLKTHSRGCCPNLGQGAIRVQLPAGSTEKRHSPQTAALLRLRRQRARMPHARLAWLANVSPGFGVMG